jgi:hypothetical protein
MADSEESPVELEIEEAAEAVEAARLAALSLEAEIRKRQNEVETSNAIADREISNLEREIREAGDFQDAEALKVRSRERSPNR